VPPDDTMKQRFDVGDAGLRAAFLRTGLPEALSGLGADARARWGHMTSQQMVEHLLWAFEISTGRVVVECLLPPAQQEMMKTFLHQNRPMPREFRNPALEGGLPPLRHANVAAASAALQAEVMRFLNPARPDERYRHPIFGPLTAEEWSRSHFKHGCHHLLQFGCIEIEAKH